MSRGAAAAVVASGAVLLAFGLLFLVGSAGQMRRLVVAGVGLASGAAVIALGVALFVACSNMAFNPTVTPTPTRTRVPTHPLSPTAALPLGLLALVLKMGTQI